MDIVGIVEVISIAVRFYLRSKVLSVWTKAACPL